MAKTVTLPTNFTASALDRFIHEVVGLDGRPVDSVIRFDFSSLNFIDGTGYTVLSNTLAWLWDQGVQCSFRKFEKTDRPAISYLDDCGFFKFYLNTRLNKNAEVRRSSIPCTAVAHASAHGWLEHKLSPWASEILRVHHSGLASVRGCVKEIFHNINDHSTLHTGFIHAQHYPTKHEVRITVSDFGCGIPTTIREKFGHMSDGEAIHYASQEGVTAKSKPNNMGAGLNYLIDRVTASEGRVQIRSLAGSLNCYNDRRQGQVRAYATRTAVYPGTLIDVSLDTRLFIGDEEERGTLEW